MKIRTPFAVLATTLSLWGTPVFAQSAQTAPEFWNNTYGKSVYERQLELETAIAQQQARNGGFGPANSTTNIGTVNATTVNNGPQTTTSSGATNIQQSSSNYTSNSSTLTGSGINLTVSTSVGQGITGNTQQGAAAQTTVGNGNSPITKGN